MARERLYRTATTLRRTVNYEVTMAMAVALVSRGCVYGRNLFHLCFPLATHDETAWGVRLHLPLQLYNGAVAWVSRARLPALST